MFSDPCLRLSNCFAREVSTQSPRRRTVGGTVANGGATIGYDSRKLTSICGSQISTCNGKGGDVNLHHTMT